MCAGIEGVHPPHLAYIYKNIAGKKYCKHCAFIMQPPKKISKVSGKQKNVIEERIKDNDRQKEFFMEIWNERKHSDGRNYCEVSGEMLPREPLTIYFDHLLEKSTYPKYRWDKRNIVIVSEAVHSLKTGGKPLPKHKELIDNLKKQLGL